MNVEIVIIAAVAENGVIGRDGKLPWHIPEDLRRFRQLTLGHCVIMGRKTFESIGKPLEGRKNIVITSQKGYEAEGVAVVHSLEEAFEGCEGTAFVIGGSSVFEETLPLASRLELTLIHRVVEGDVYFPPVGKEWKEAAREDREGFSFVTYRKVK